MLIYKISMLILSCIIIQTNVYTQDTLEIGGKIKSHVLLKENNYDIMVSPNSFYKSYNIYLSGIEYTFCMNKDSIIFFISTKDPHFVSSSTRVGSNVNEIGNYIQKFKEPGWANYYLLHTNWNAAHMDGDSVITFFFKRDLINYLLPRD